MKKINFGKFDAKEDVVLPIEVDRDLAELLGIILGDGCLSLSGRKNFIYISGHKIDDLEYHIHRTKNLFKILFNKDIAIKFRNDENTLYIKFCNISIFNKLSSLGIPIGKKYSQLKIPGCIDSDNLFCAFMKGLFDTDGCVVLSKQHKKVHYYPRLEIASKSLVFLQSILVRLKLMGFYGSVSTKGKHFRLEIPGFTNLELWMKLVNLNNPKHIKKVNEINSKRL